MGLTEQQRKETVELIRSALVDGLGFEDDADRWLRVLAFPSTWEKPVGNGLKQVGIGR